MWKRLVGLRPRALDPLLGAEAATCFVSPELRYLIVRARVA